MQFLQEPFLSVIFIFISTQNNAIYQQTVMENDESWAVSRVNNSVSVNQCQFAI